jgi:uncharacterized protein
VKLEQSFEVKAPLQEVWRALIEVERVAPCLPGAEVTEVSGDGTYHGTFQVRLGPTTAVYRGTLEIESLDEATRTATMRAVGTDKRGQGGARATMRSTLREGGGATQVHVDTDFAITGRLARFGRGGMVEDVSNRLLQDFADCLRSTIEQPVEETGLEQGEIARPRPTSPEPRPIRGFSLLFRALLDRLRRMLRPRR